MKTHTALSVLFAGVMALVLVRSDVCPALAQGPSKFSPTVSKAVKSDRSLPLRELRATAATARSFPHLPLIKPATPPQVNGPTARDPLLAIQSFAAAMPSPLKSFEGISNTDNATLLHLTPIPPDPNGDIGYDPVSGKRFYVQWDNLVFAVWDVTGTPNRVFGPFAGNALWSGFSGNCENTNFGDPIVLFDPLARRWLLSQFAFTSANPTITGPFYQCIAISQTADPTGSYFRYQFLISNTNFNDYPKFGVWPDAYYMSSNQFDSNGSFVGGRATAFERDQMLAGNTARLVSFDLSAVNQNFGGQLPSDFDGLIAPPTGSPNYFVEVDPKGVINASHDTLAIWQFHVDWNNPANSTFGQTGSSAGQPNQVLFVASFNLMPCAFMTHGCIPQPGTTEMLDPIGDRLMYRLQYRNYSNHESLVTNHTVNLGSSLSPQAGIRWYELRKTGSTWNINQQGTFGPDSNNRWLGSIAADAQGNIALGYSLSSASVFPSVMYAGRLATDPLGTLPQGEVALMTGSGSQTDTADRWGDYSMLAVDPLDDCTFWYTNEYYPSTSQRGWNTHIGAFRFPSCGIPSGPFRLFLPLISR